MVQIVIRNIAAIFIKKICIDIWLKNENKLHAHYTYI